MLRKHSEKTEIARPKMKHGKAGEARRKGENIGALEQEEWLPSQLFRILNSAVLITATNSIV